MEHSTIYWVISHFAVIFGAVAVFALSIGFGARALHYVWGEILSFVFGAPQIASRHGGR